MIRQQYAKGASEQEFAVLLEQARLKRLNPLLGQIHFVKRTTWSKELGYHEVWATQTSIDGFRSIADETGLYDGQDEPEFTYEAIVNQKNGEVLGKRLVSAKVRVYRKDIQRAFPAICIMDEFVQKTKNGDVTKMWAEKPHVMLAKCAEAAALRKAFPQQLGDLYTKEEIVQAEDTPNAGAQIAGAMAPKPAALAAPAPPPIDQALQRITKCETNDQLDEVVTELSPVFKKKAEREVLRVATTKRREEIAARDISKAEQPAEDIADGEVDDERPPEDR